MKRAHGTKRQRREGWFGWILFGFLFIFMLVLWIISIVVYILPDGRQPYWWDISLLILMASGAIFSFFMGILPKRNSGAEKTTPPPAPLSTAPPFSMRDIGNYHLWDVIRCLSMAFAIPFFVAGMQLLIASGDLIWIWTIIVGLSCVILAGIAQVNYKKTRQRTTIKI